LGKKKIEMRDESVSLSRIEEERELKGKNEKG